MCKGVLVFIAGVAAPLALLGQGSPQIIWQQTLDSDRVNALAYTPDGTQVITGSSDRLIHIYNADTGGAIQVLDSGAPDVHASSVECLAINSSGTMLATVCSNYLKLWDLPSGNEHVIDADASWVVWCDFSPDGSEVATATFDDAKIKVWDTSGDLLRSFDANGVQRVAVFSPNGQWLASAGGDNVVTVRSTSDWSVVATLTGATDDIYVMRFSPDSSMIASGGYDMTCHVWSTANWSPLYSFSNTVGNVYAVAFSPDSQTLAYSEGENNRIDLVDTTSGNIIQTYDQNTPNVQCMAFSPTEGYLAYGSADDTVFVANVGVSGSGGGGGGGGGGTPTESQVTINVNGNGVVQPNRNGQTLVDGKKYTLAAVADPGNRFVNWTDGNGNVLGQAAGLIFTNENGLALNANFIPNPFPAVAGLYEGLIASDPATEVGAGRFNLTVATGGSFSGGFQFNGTVRIVSGVFKLDGSYSGAVGNLQVSLQLDVTTGSDQITGFISNGSVTSSVSADRLVWNARSNPAPSGGYTALLEPDTGQSDSPQGFGYVVVNIYASGQVTAVGYLADGTCFTESTYLSKNMTWPFYAFINASESAIGQITMESLSGSDMDGSVAWFRGANGRAVYYPSGFSAQVALVGSDFTPPTAGQTALVFDNSGGDNASVSITGADVTTAAPFSGIVNSNDRFTADASSGPTGGFSLLLGPRGGMSGGFIDPATGRRVAFLGAVLQKQNIAAGFFLSSGQSGSVQLTPTP